MHEYDEIFAALRAENNLELDHSMASAIASEPHAWMVDGPEAAKGRAFAAEIARNHGVEGVRSLDRCLRDPVAHHGKPSGDEFMDSVTEELLNPEAEQSMDAAIRKQLDGKSDSFMVGILVFCGCSGVV